MKKLLCKIIKAIAEILFMDIVEKLERWIKKAKSKDPT